MQSIFTPRTQLFAALLSGLLLALGVVLHTWLALAHTAWIPWVSLAIGLVYGGKAAFDSLVQKTFDIDVLMAVGAILAAYIGHPEEGALLLFLFVLSGALEDLALEKTQREITSLHALIPQVCQVLRGGQWVPGDTESLLPGERIKVRPGERIPADATVAEGASSIDQSALTGESLPREVRKGDELFAGTVNLDDPIEAVVVRTPSESSLQKILDLVSSARDQREPVQRIIDRLSQPYSIGVMVTSIAIGLIWWLGFGDPLLGSESEKGALYTAITFLIVASPCALIIATPTATLASIARAARGGVLFKGGDAIERLARTGAICLDKTGTLTFGRPKVYQVHPVALSNGEELLGLAAALEQDSTHPIAHAIREAAAERNIPPSSQPLVINHVVAKGLEARYGTQDDTQPARRIRLGSFSFAEQLIPVCYKARVREVIEKIQLRGHIGVIIAAEAPPPAPGAQQDDSLAQCAVIIMADSLRPGTTTLVETLHGMEIKPVVMLTGDNRLTGERIGATIGLDEVYAELLPADKLAHLKRVKTEIASRPKRRNGVAAVGDGINDAPILAGADVSMAMGTIGTAAAMEHADIVFLTESLDTLPWAISLARATRLTIRINLVVALSAMIVMAVIALVASRMGNPIPLSLGVLAHEGGTLVVVFNSLWLLRYKRAG